MEEELKKLLKENLKIRMTCNPDHQEGKYSNFTTKIEVEILFGDEKISSEYILMDNKD